MRAVVVGPRWANALGTVDGHPVVLCDNTEGSAGPCIGVEVRDPDATTVTIACPSSPTEDDQYAATIEVGSDAFVVGFGLADDETIVDDQFTDVFVFDQVDGRRFFAAQLADGESASVVTISDGTVTRQIRSS